MKLSNELVSQFAQLLTEDHSKKNADDIIYGIVHKDGVHTYVKLDGSDIYTPVVLAASADEGDRVGVMIRNHSAMAGFNISSPSVNSRTFDSYREAVNGQFNRIDATYITAENANLTFATIASLEALQGQFDKLDVKFITIDQAKINFASVKDLEAVNGKVSNLETTTLKATDAELKYATIDSLNAADAKITSLTSTVANIDKAYISRTETTELLAKYAQVDFSNVAHGTIDSALIRDGAITDAKIHDISASKLTAGTIDASKITVTNLNADNITVGTINGQRIGNKSIDLSKLAEEVPTKEYLDSKADDLQKQIDNAIETYTVTTIPTLNNSPAEEWTDNDTRNKHIGDVAYVVNSQDTANGYCYRFANTGSVSEPVYEWVLVKDSDVTKALQELITVKGDISGLKSFETNTSKWITNTDSTLNSLLQRTSKVETDLGTKVSTDVFNEVKQTVDENSSSITKMSETIQTKADGSTVEKLTNTVNSVKQTTEQNSASIGSLQKTVEMKADGSTVESLEKRTSSVEQNLEGFKSSVSKTYVTSLEYEKNMDTINKDVSDAVSNAGSALNTVNGLQKRMDSGEFKGEKGDDSVLLVIDSSNGAVFKNSDIATTFTVTIIVGDKTITSARQMHEVFGTDAYLQWACKQMGESEFSPLDRSDKRVSDEGFIITLAAKDIQTKAVFTCSLNM